MIDLLYVAYNRIEMTKESFQSLIDNTDWSEVDYLMIHDDASDDGTAEWLREASREVEAAVIFQSKKLGGPVDAMNWLLDNEDLGTDTFGKIDNDMVVPPGWLNDMLKTMTLYPGVDILGMEPFVGNPTSCPAPRTPTYAEHMGGKGLIRRRCFSHCRMVARGYQGWTQYQTKHPELVKAWVTPDIPCFGLDQLPFEPWLSLEAEYVAKGWQRHWPHYDEGATGYWDWWTPKYMETT